MSGLPPGVATTSPCGAQLRSVMYCEWPTPSGLGQASVFPGAQERSCTPSGLGLHPLALPEVQPRCGQGHGVHPIPKAAGWRPCSPGAPEACLGH